MKVRALLGKHLHKTKHIPSLPYSEALAFYQWLKGRPQVSALALRFLLLTIARTTELRLATFGEITDDVWLLPPERTKNGKEHRIPLTKEALAVVSEAKKLSDSEYLFLSPRGKPLSNMAMSSLMKREGYKAKPHGFRATFRTWVEE